MGLRGGGAWGRASSRGQEPRAISSPPQVESNFGSYHQFLMQALIYLGSPHKNLKRMAMKFIGRCGPGPCTPSLAPLAAAPWGQPGRARGAAPVAERTQLCAPPTR